MQKLNPAENDLYEYLLIISPAKEIADKVMQEKNHFSKTYAWPATGQAVPYITVSNFIAWTRMEDTLIRWMQRLVAEQNSFSVTINNYSGFPSHTIFLSAVETAPFKELASRLKIIAQYIKENGCAPVHLITKPHITIARGIPVDIYDRAISDYSNKDFSASFKVTRLELLRRRHQYDKCVSLAQFYFKPIEHYYLNTSL